MSYPVNRILTAMSYFAIYLLLSCCAAKRAPVAEAISTVFTRELHITIKVDAKGLLANSAVCRRANSGSVDPHPWKGVIPLDEHSPCRADMALCRETLSLYSRKLKLLDDERRTDYFSTTKPEHQVVRDAWVWYEDPSGSNWSFIHYRDGVLHFELTSENGIQTFYDVTGEEETTELMSIIGVDLRRVDVLCPK